MYFEPKIESVSSSVWFVSSVVMAIRLSPPSRCFTAFSAVFLASVSGKLPLTSADIVIEMPRQLAISVFQDNRNDLKAEAATFTCFWLKTLA